MMCKKCNLEFGSDTELHKHIRTHNMLLQGYYHAYEPRRDLLTNELIPFKSKEHYFNNNFTNRANFREWYSQQSVEVLREYSLDFLKNRKEKKNIVFAPSQVELRSLQCPSIIGYNKLFGDYYKICYELGFRVRFEKPYPLVYPYPHENPYIIIDTREQAPLQFNIKTKVGTLNVGDYTYEADNKLSDLCFERKSLNDFVSSFGAGFKRVRKEFVRARDSGRRIVVIIEEDLKYALIFNQLPFFPTKMKVTPEFVFHNVREAMQEFPNIQFLFVKNRYESARVIEKIFIFDCEYLKFDLQLLYDLEEI